MMTEATEEKVWISPGPGEWTPTLQREALAMLREPFPAETVGILPKPYKRESPKGDCKECGGYHGLPAVHLDYVGHAAVTDRLLTVDPWWDWEPFSTDDMGLPALDSQGNMWIKLTIAKVTRIGYGDGPDAKQRIGDAIRNAGIRFGIALQLWSKDELESLIGNEKAKASRRKAPKSSTPANAGSRVTATDPATDGQEGMTAKHKNRLISHLAKMEPPIRGGDAQQAHIKVLLGLNEMVPITKLTVDQGAELFKLLGIDPS
jgi:hypothetical protein